MKKAVFSVFLVVISFALSGCFVLETFFPPIGENEAKVSVYLNYYTINRENRNIKSIEIPIKSISLNGNKKDDVGNKVLTLRCDQKFTDFGTFFGFYSSLSNFVFPADTTLTGPHVEMEFESPLKVTYLKEDIGGAQATEVYFSVPADKRKIDMKIKTLAGNLNEMSELDLPEGQSEIIMMLNLDGIIPLKDIGGDVPTLTNGFNGSFAMLTDDICLVSGKLTDTNETPILHAGEGFVVNLSSTFYLGETQFNYLSYPVFSDSVNRYYYMLIPQQTNSGYSSTVKVNIPDKPLKDVSKTVTIPYDKQNLEVDFEFMSGD